MTILNSRRSLQFTTPVVPAGPVSPSMAGAAITSANLNFRTGRLDPSYAAIARKANVCERTVANALKRLKELGILNWVRRCAESWRDGKFVLEQETNAYAVLPSTQWVGYDEPVDPPPPEAGTWGDHPPCPLCWHRQSPSSSMVATCDQ